jgi:uridine phosphorylase
MKKYLVLFFCFLVTYSFAIFAMSTPNGTVTDLISNDKKLAPIGIIAAHPERIERIAREFLQDVESHTDYRGYKVYTGTYKGYRVFAAYTAMGGPSVAMILENLIVAGAKKIIRIGTSDNDNNEQDLSILNVVTETIGGEGMKLEYGFEPEEIDQPIPASRDLLNNIISSAKKFRSIKIKETKNYNIDAYHVYSNPNRFAKNPERIKRKIEFYKSQGATTRDMESGTLFMISQLRGVEAATILIPRIKHNQETEEQKQISLNREKEAIILALEALIK